MPAWWDKKWGKNSICGITFKRLRPGRDEYGFRKCTFLHCGHGFYSESIISWIMNQPGDITTCPMCRHTIIYVNL